MALSLLDFPHEILLLLIGAVDPADLLALSETCRGMNAIVGDTSLRGRLMFGRYLRAHGAGLDLLYHEGTIEEIEFLDRQGKTAMGEFPLSRDVIATLGHWWPTSRVPDRYPTLEQAHRFLDLFTAYHFQRFKQLVARYAVSRLGKSEFNSRFSAVCERAFATRLLRLLFHEKHVSLVRSFLKFLDGGVLSALLLPDVYQCDDVGLYETLRFKPRFHYGNTNPSSQTALELLRGSSDAKALVHDALLTLLKHGAWNIFRYVVRNTRDLCPITATLLDHTMTVSLRVPSVRDLLCKAWLERWVLYCETDDRDARPLFYPLLRAWIDACQPLSAEEENAFLGYVFYTGEPSVVEALMEEYKMEFSSPAAMLTPYQLMMALPSKIAPSFRVYLARSRWKRFSTVELREALAGLRYHHFDHSVYLQLLDAYCFEKELLERIADDAAPPIKRARLT